MHGLIHTLFKDFVIQNYGSDSWIQVMSVCGIEDDSSILDMKTQYDDDRTFALMKAAAGLLEVPLDDVQERFGEYFALHLPKIGWSKMLAGMGRNLQEFIENLNELHHGLVQDFRNSVFPYLETQTESKGFLLIYTSRRFLPYFFRGAMRGVSKGLFGTEIDFEVRSSGSNTITWFVVEKTAREITVHPETRVATTSFDFHQAIASLFSCGKETWCQSSETLSTIDAKEQNNRANRRKQTDSTIAAFRAEHCIPDDVQLRDWLKDLTNEFRLDLVTKLMRSVPASRIAVPWSKIKAPDTSTAGPSGSSEAVTLEFWMPNQRLPDYYNWSVPPKNDLISMLMCRFLSRAWDVPADWNKLIGEECTYSDVTAAMLCTVAKDIAAQHLGDSERWSEVQFWIDKCCVRQDDTEILLLNAGLIKQYVAHSSGMVVVLSWSYFSRLWCAFEWAVFFIVHSPDDLIICGEFLYREATEDSFIVAIRNFRVWKCECFSPSQRALLEDCITENFRSEQDFERFVKFTAIAMMGRCLVLRRARSNLTLNRWTALAEELGFTDLSAALKSARPEQWRESALQGKPFSLERDLQVTVSMQCDDWAAEKINPLIHAERVKTASQTVNEEWSKRNSVSSMASIRAPPN